MEKASSRARSQFLHFKAKRLNPQLDLSDKAAQLLKVLVEEYLEDGQPVSSSKVAEKSRFSVSSATVRNNMTKLQEYGLVSSPHTSAGRIPTQHGLRFFIDGLISYEPLDRHAERQVWDELARDQSTQEMLESASQLLSEVTQLAGLVTIPREEQFALRQVEFLQLSGRQVLAILIVNEREVQNRVIETDRSYSTVELNQAANYINEAFAGRSLDSIRSGVLESMSQDKAHINSILQRAFEIASKTFVEREHDFVVSGESNLVDKVASTEKIKVLLEAFESKSSIVHLLDACIDGEDARLFIGQESGYEPFEDYSLITAPYEVNGKVAGVLGVIGPTRMSYQKVVPLVDATSRAISHLIERN